MRQPETIFSGKNGLQGRRLAGALPVLRGDIIKGDNMLLIQNVVIHLVIDIYLCL